MKLDSLDTLMTEELRDVYDAEKQITKALPKLVKAANAQELKDALEEHLEITKGQITRLEEIFALLDQKPRSRPCAGMKGILEEGNEMLHVDKRGSSENLMDAAIISAAQRVEHYEIAAYGTLRTFAETLGNNRVAQLLEQTKEEEEEADRKLSSISEQLLAAERNGMGEEDEDTEVEEDEEVEEDVLMAGNGRHGSKHPPAARSRRK
jgi:ferritin-like metal-binding protein YciE